MWILLALGCGVVEKPIDDHSPKPDMPDVVVVKSPVESYWKAMAKRVEKRVIASPQEMATIARQLQLSGEIAPEDFTALGNAFPGMLKDAKSFSDPKAAAATLRSLK